VARAEVYLHAKFYLDPSNHLATVHERDRQDRQLTDSIGWTVLQTVAQKWNKKPSYRWGTARHGRASWNLAKFCTNV